ncbi:hypothetical protein ACOME3_009280 [Neoechinorhynchus agilis]
MKNMADSFIDGDLTATSRRTIKYEIDKLGVIIPKQISSHIKDKKKHHVLCNRQFKLKDLNEQIDTYLGDESRTKVQEALLHNAKLLKKPVEHCDDCLVHSSMKETNKFDQVYAPKVDSRNEYSALLSQINSKLNIRSTESKCMKKRKKSKDSGRTSSTVLKTDSISARTRSMCKRK